MNILRLKIFISFCFFFNSCFSVRPSITNKNYLLTGPNHLLLEVESSYRNSTPLKKITFKKLECSIDKRLIKADTNIPNSKHTVLNSLIFKKDQNTEIDFTQNKVVLCKKILSNSKPWELDAAQTENGNPILGELLTLFYANQQRQYLIYIERLIDHGASSISTVQPEGKSILKYNSLYKALNELQLKSICSYGFGSYVHETTLIIATVIQKRQELVNQFLNDQALFKTMLLCLNRFHPEYNITDPLTVSASYLSKDLEDAQE